MTIEEKARAYDEAIERAREVIKNNPDFVRVTPRLMEEIFPELEESEDERIRKNCIHFLELQKTHHAATFEIDECIAWLERQKPTEWSEEDEVGLGDALWPIEQATTIVKNENEMGNLWYAERWLKSLKQRLE